MLRATAFVWAYSLGFLLIDMHGKGQEIMVGLVFILTVSIDITLDLQADISLTLWKFIFPFFSFSCPHSLNGDVVFPNACPSGRTLERAQQCLTLYSFNSSKGQYFLQLAAGVAS